MDTSGNSSSARYYPPTRGTAASMYADNDNESIATSRPRSRNSYYDDYYSRPPNYEDEYRRRGRDDYHRRERDDYMYQNRSRYRDYPPEPNYYNGHRSSRSNYGGPAINPQSYHARACLEELRVKQPEVYRQWYAEYTKHFQNPRKHPFPTIPGYNAPQTPRLPHPAASSTQMSISQHGAGDMSHHEASFTSHNNQHSQSNFENSERKDVHSGRSSVNDELALSSLNYDPNYHHSNFTPINHYAQYTETPIERMTPKKYHTAHCIGFITPLGKLIQINNGGTTLEITSLKELLQNRPEYKIVNEFPGPLIKGVTHKNKVIKFCEKKIEIAKLKETQFDQENFVLLWELLILLVKQNGSVIGSDIAELLLKNAKLRKQSIEQNGISEEEDDNNEEETEKAEAESEQTNDAVITETVNTNNDPLPKDEKSVIEDFSNLLLYGHKKDALEFAIKNGLWGHALFLASKMDDKTYGNVMARFANGMSLNDPLQTLYQILSGKQPSSVTSCCDISFGDWKPHLAMILSNIGNRPDVEMKSIITMGDTLGNRNHFFAAQFCYLMANVEFSSKTKLGPLLGYSSSSSNNNILESTQMTEIYEFAKNLATESNYSLGIPFLQNKLNYTKTLVDLGFSEEAYSYCEEMNKNIKYINSLEQNLKASNQREFEAIKWSVLSIAERLVITEETDEHKFTKNPQWIEDLREALPEINFYRKESLVSSSNTELESYIDRKNEIPLVVNNNESTQQQQQQQPPYYPPSSSNVVEPMGIETNENTNNIVNNIADGTTNSNHQQQEQFIPLINHDNSNFQIQQQQPQPFVPPPQMAPIQNQQQQQNQYFTEQQQPSDNSQISMNSQQQQQQQPYSNQPPSMPIFNMNMKAEQDINRPYEESNNNNTYNANNALYSNYNNNISNNNNNNQLYSGYNNNNNMGQNILMPSPMMMPQQGASGNFHNNHAFQSKKKTVRFNEKNQTIEDFPIDDENEISDQATNDNNNINEVSFVNPSQQQQAITTIPSLPITKSALKTNLSSYIPTKILPTTTIQRDGINKTIKYMEANNIPSLTLDFMERPKPKNLRHESVDDDDEDCECEFEEDECEDDFDVESELENETASYFQKTYPIDNPIEIPDDPLNRNLSCLISANRRGMTRSTFPIDRKCCDALKPCVDHDSYNQLCSSEMIAGLKVKGQVKSYEDTGSIPSSQGPSHNGSPIKQENKDSNKGANKQMNKGDDLLGKNQQPGLFGGIFSKFSFKPKNQMKLPDDKNPSIVWDDKKKCWTNLKGDDEGDSGPKGPPPKDSDLKFSSLPPQQPSSMPPPQFNSSYPPSGPQSNNFYPTAMNNPPNMHATNNSLPQQQQPLVGFQSNSISPPNNPPQQPQMIQQQPQTQQHQQQHHNINNQPLMPGNPVQNPTPIPNQHHQQQQQQQQQPSFNNNEQQSFNTSPSNNSINNTINNNNNNNRFKLPKGGRSIRNSYVDVLNPNATKISENSQQQQNGPPSLAQNVPNMFIPPPIASSSDGPISFLTPNILPTTPQEEVPQNQNQPPQPQMFDPSHFQNNMANTYNYNPGNQ